MLDLKLEYDDTSVIIISLGIILLSGFLVTRITKMLKLPNVTGYIFAGIILGPYVLGLLPQEIIFKTEFVTDIALSYIAFGVGKYFKLSAIIKNGKKVFIITLFESLCAAFIISLVMIFICRLPVSFSILLGAIGCATAPASTIMTIRQYKAKGKFVDTALQVIALDDAVSLIAFSICATITKAAYSGSSVNFNDVVMPIIWNLISVLLGVLFAHVLNYLINSKRSREHRLVLVNVLILSIAGFCAVFQISPLLGCMVLGMVYINLSNNKSLFKQVNGFTPPILLIFFVLSGVRLDVSSLATAGVIGSIYFVIRIAGKYIGAFLGGTVCGADSNVKKYLGLALIPQAGVSIGLASLGQRLLPQYYGTMLSTIILSSAVLYEIIGPACAKASLFLSKSIKSKI